VIPLGPWLMLAAGAAYADARWRLIPNPLTAGAALGVLAWRLAHGTLAAGGAGAAVVAVVLGLAEVASRSRLGGGDWKYALVIGAGLGPWGGLGALGLAALLSTAWGLTRVRTTGWRAPHAFGPWLAVGAVLAWGAMARAGGG